MLANPPSHKPLVVLSLRSRAWPAPTKAFYPLIVGECLEVPNCMPKPRAIKNGSLCEHKLPF